MARAANDTDFAVSRVMNGNAEEVPYTESKVKKSETGISRLGYILVNASRELLGMAEGLRDITPWSLTKERDLQEEKGEGEGNARNTYLWRSLPFNVGVTAN